MMKTEYKSKARNLSRVRAGFGVIMVSVINAIEFQKKMFGNDDVLINVKEVNRQFRLKKNAPRHENREDLEELISNSTFRSPSNAHSIGKYQDLEFKNEIFNDFFEFRNLATLEKARENLITDKTLGVHLRGTDKAGEIKPPSHAEIIMTITNYLQRFNLEKIFLATDDIAYVRLLKQEFGERVILPNTRKISSNGKPIHLRYFRNHLNEQVVEDIYLLSKCPYFLYSSSNVSYLALIVGLCNFKEFEYVGNSNSLE